MRIAFVGHVSVDINNVKGTASTVYGGGVVYGSIAAARLGAEVRVFTKCRPEDLSHFAALGEAGVEVVLLPSETSTSIQNDYPTDDPDDRTSRLISRAAPFTAEDVERIETDVLHVNPLALGEFPPELIPIARRQTTLLGADAQGFLRVPEADGALTYRDWADKGRYLPELDLLKVDVHEGEVLTGETEPAAATRALRELGVKTVVFTEARAMHVLDGERFLSGEFGSYTLEGRTGRGDTCTAAYLVARANAEPEAAIQRAAAVTAKKLQYPGPLRGE